ncbi:MAG: hypothetical protein AAF639_00540 [Chloroflexota bacterium]
MFTSALVITASDIASYVSIKRYRSHQKTIKLVNALALPTPKVEHNQSGILSDTLRRKQRKEIVSDYDYEDEVSESERRINRYFALSSVALGLTAVAVLLNAFKIGDLLADNRFDIGFG